jgi:predicted Rossmann fold nucleotide-binding protein DprA/Smf involved in DNA uptake
MKELETLMKTFGEGLRTLAQGVHAIADKLDSYVESAKDEPDFESEPETDFDDMPSEAAAKTAAETDFQQKPAVSATDVVHEAVIGAAGPITMDELCEKTGYDRKKLNNILYRLRKQDKIKNVKKGVYTKK